MNTPDDDLLLEEPPFEFMRAALAPPRAAYPLSCDKVSAGFPSPAADYTDTELDINDYLVRNKDATFFFVVKGDSMRDFHVFDGDVLVVDRSITPVSGNIVIALVGGECVCKQLYSENGCVELRAGNPAYKPLVAREDGLEIWGVVVGTFKRIAL